MGISPRLVTIRASAALPAAGAWDAAPTEVFVDDMEAVTLYVTYTRGGAAGSVGFQIQVSPYSANDALLEDWFPPSVKSIGAFAAGSDTTGAVQREGSVVYVATGAAAETFAYALEFNGTAQRMRVLCQEVGNVGAPGTVHIAGLLRRSEAI